MVPDSTKITWTKSVATFEGGTTAARARNGAAFKTLLDAAPHWDDASSPWFGDGWDNKQNLIRRTVRAWQDAIIATRAPNAAPQSVAGAAVSGFAEGGAGAAGKLAQGAADVTNNVIDGAREISKSPKTVAAIALALVALVLYLRLRG